MRRGTKRAVAAMLIVGGIVYLRPGTHANRVARHRVDTAGRRLRHLGGRLQGLSYRMRGRQPDPDVADDIVADRIRSSLGGLEKRLDVPHIHVMVEGHVALLHGAVGSSDDAEELERAVAAVPGVVGVESYLHIGLGSGDTRPSAGKTHGPPSEARSRLIDAAISAGIDAGSAGQVVRAILGAFADRLPPGERDQVAAHLPADVRELFTPPRRTRTGTPPRTTQEFLSRLVAATPGLDEPDAERVATAVLRALGSLVPEEQADVAAVLPAQLRQLWQPPTPADSPQAS